MDRQHDVSHIGEWQQHDRQRTPSRRIAAWSDFENADPNPTIATGVRTDEVYVQHAVLAANDERGHGPSQAALVDNEIDPRV
jgi:hypothetical protein